MGQKEHDATSGRVGFGMVGLGAAIVLVLARLITPHPSGHGTHTALGLPACPFLSWSGLPCPACGLTTSFAWLARAELGAAFEAHALGPTLFVLTLLCVPFCVWGLCRPAAAGAWLARLHAPLCALALAVAFAVAWLLRLQAL